MARTLSLGVTLALVVVLVAAGIAGGYAIGRWQGGSGGSGRSGPASTLSVIAAGTLGVPFGSVAQYLENTTPGVSVPTASQQYEGSLAVMTAVRSAPSAYDVVAAADFRLIPQNLEPATAGWEAVFATSPEALVYDPTVAALAGINTTNWPEKVLDSGLPLGLANASTDPNGYNEIFVLELEGLLDNGSLSSLYSHFFTTPVGALAIPNPATTRVEVESNVASLIQTHAIGLFITYRSYAVSHGLSYVDFAPSVGLGSTNASELATYATASTTILTAGGSAVVQGAPVLFSVTVPTALASSSYGLNFVGVLLSPAGEAILSADGLTPIFPGWCDEPASVPGILAPDVTPLPPALSAELAG